MRGAASSEHTRLRGRAGQRQRQRRLHDHPLCATCKAQGRIVETEVIDHIIPLDFDGTDTDDNVQGLCKACHAVKTIADFGYKDRSVATCDASGDPIDPRHPWNQK